MTLMGRIGLLCSPTTISVWTVVLLSDQLPRHYNRRINITIECVIEVVTVKWEGTGVEFMVEGTRDT